MSVSRRRFLAGTGLASLGSLAGACRPKENANAAGASSQNASATTKLQGRALSVPSAAFRRLRPATEGRLRVDFVGLGAFIAGTDDASLTVALVKTEAAKLNLPPHFPTLMVARYAIDPMATTLGPLAATEDWAIYGLSGTSVQLKAVKNGNRINLPKLTINRKKGPTVGPCPVEQKNPWNDFDWVLSARELTPNVTLLKNEGWRSWDINQCLIDLPGGVIEDAMLAPDQGRFKYQWKIDQTNQTRALKEIVRYTVDSAAADGATAIDIIVTPAGGGPAHSVRCNLSTPDPFDAEANMLDAYVQIAHMPAVPVHGKGLEDLRALYLLTDPTSRPADLNDIVLPEFAHATCDSPLTSECGCCPPVSFSA